MRTKTFIFSLTLGISAIVFGGEDWQKFPVGPFGTLNDRDSSYAIGATQSQSLLNVDLTPAGKSVRKRKGYGIAFTLNQTTSPVHGVYDFFDAQGNEVNLFFNDTKIYGSVGGATPTVLLSTGPNGATYQCTDSLGFAYCANTSRTTLYKTNGSTLTQIQSVSSTGTMVATAVTRLAMAGFSDAPSRIDFSADTDFTTWGSGSVGTSATQFTINAPGAKITHIVYAFNRLMWFKDTSFGYILIGNQPFQSDWVIKTISYDVGTNDNSSVYREGILYFRGKDGHIYTFDGNTYERLTREISGTVGVSQTRGTGSWNQTSQSDFDSGLYSNTTSTQTVGSVQLLLLSTSTKKTKYGADISNTGGSCLQSAPYYWSKQFLSTQSYVVSGIMLRMSTTSTPSGTLTINILNDNAGIPGSIIISTSISHFSFTNTAADYLFNFNQPWGALTAGSTYWYQQISAAGVSSFINYVDGVDDGYLRSCGASISADNIPLGGGLKYKLFGATYSQSGVYYSSVHNAPNLTLWDNFIADFTQISSTQSFYIRSSTGVFYSSATSPSWTSVTNGNIPAISTNPYFQIRSDFSSAGSSTSLLNLFTVNWFEGNAADKAYATYFNDKILWSVTSGTGSTTNNRVLLYDMLNQGWLLYDIPSNGFYVKNNDLYFGGSSSGYIFKFGDVENDNGSAINSYWKSKDYFGGDPFTTQELANISLAAKTVSNSSMTVTYTTNGSSSSVFTFPMSSSRAFVGLNKNLPAGTVGSNFNIQFGNNAADQPWELFGAQIGIRPKSWIPGQQ